VAEFVSEALQLSAILNSTKSLFDDYGLPYFKAPGVDELGPILSRVAEVLWRVDNLIKLPTKQTFKIWMGNPLFEDIT
jgi:hypothetical protein